MTSRSNRTSESEYIDRQIEEASGALSHTLKAAGSDLAEMSDPRTWVRQYPWVMTALAAASTSYLGWKIGWGRNEKLRRKWKAFSRDLKTSFEKPSGRPARGWEAYAREHRRRDERGGVFLVLLSLLPPLVKAMSPMLKTATSAAMHRAPKTR